MAAEVAAALLEESEREQSGGSTTCTGSSGNASHEAERLDEAESMETAASPTGTPDRHLRGEETPEPVCYLHPSPQSGSCSPQVSPGLSDTGQELSELKTLTKETYVDECKEIIQKGNVSLLTHDPSQSTGLVQFVVKNFSALQGTVLSEPVYIRNLPWRLMVMPRFCKTAEGDLKYVGIFVQCNPDATDTPGWLVTATANISLVNLLDPKKTHSKDIFHNFCAKENDWGYANFAPWKEIADSDEGFVQNDTILVRALVLAEAPHHCNWDSKKQTGFVGLKNQGATCYMNSVLQTLYCTNVLRTAVYKMPTENDDGMKSIPLALQRLFYDLQHSDRPVGTKKLTKSFGWDTMDIFMQHDVQELCRVLLDNIENKMNGTVVEGTIPRLFEGKMESFIRCTSVRYESTRVESFFDIQLKVKGMKDVYASFKEYVAVEKLDGENKYDAGDHGLQPAKKGVRFLNFPPVLHLQLMRFQYDPATDSNAKINDRYRFPEQLNLEKFLKEPQSTPARYTLHAVLVHSGDNYGGHYVAYINPKGDGKWFKFDDDVVSKCTKDEAIKNNYGGSDDIGRNCANAYMLSYVRDSCIDSVLHEVTDDDISPILVKRIQDEKHLELLRRKERNEAHLYFTVEVITDDLLQEGKGANLIDFDEQRGKLFKVQKDSCFNDMHDTIAKSMNVPSGWLRLWPFEHRQNNTFRPSYLNPEETENKTILELADKRSTWHLFAEVLSPDSVDVVELPDFDFQKQVKFFVKYYDPLQKKLTYLSHICCDISHTFSDYFPTLRKMASLLPSTPLMLFEEVTPNDIERINPILTINQLEEVRDGDIICFQRSDILMNSLETPIAPDYYRELVNQLEVTFFDKSVPIDPGFTLVLNQRMNYMEMATAVAQQLNTKPVLLQFFRPNVHRQLSDQAIRCTNEGNLRDFVVSRNNRMDAAPTLYFQKLGIPIDEFERKRWFKCVFISSKLKEEKEFTVYVNKNDTVAEMLAEARKEITSVGADAELRLLEVMGGRIIDIHSSDRPVSDLVSQKLYRVEEVISEESSPSDNSGYIPVAHFHKVVHNTFGIPFLLPFTNGERLSVIKEKIRSLLDVSTKDFEKWRICLVGSTRVIILSEERDPRLLFEQFNINPSKGVIFPRVGSPWLGLDHVNRNPKRSRYVVERAIKIHN